MHSIKLKFAKKKQKKKTPPYLEESSGFIEKQFVELTGDVLGSVATQLSLDAAHQRFELLLPRSLVPDRKLRGVELPRVSYAGVHNRILPAAKRSPRVFLHDLSDLQRVNWKADFFWNAIDLESREGQLHRSSSCKRSWALYLLERSHDVLKVRGLLIVIFGRTRYVNPPKHVFSLAQTLCSAIFWRKAGAACTQSKGHWCFSRAREVYAH